MKLKVANQETEKEPEVEISLGFTAPGRVSVYANGTAILWIGASGAITRNTAASETLSKMGFIMDGKAVLVR